LTSSSKTARRTCWSSFFAPWCGHCKALAPKYEKLAKVFADEPAVGIASVDCDANADLCQQYGVSGYPTIKFFSKTDKDGDAYNGGRELEDLVIFINEKAGTERLPSGGLTEKAGRVAELDDLADEFMSNHKAAFAKVDAVIAAVKEGEKALAEYYKTVMKQVMERGVSFVSGEIARLEKMIASKSVAGSKITDFAKKLNILKQFD